MNIDMTNLYEINKAAMEKEPLMTEEKIKAKQKELEKYFCNCDRTYFMLLNREKADYTVFRIGYLGDEKAAEETIGCLTDRGKIIAIDKQDNGAYECWIKNITGVFMYALFPCDTAVIECSLFPG